MNNSTGGRSFYIGSMFKYIAKKWWLLIAAALLGVALFAGAYIKTGKTFSDDVKDKDVITAEEVEELQQELDTVKINLENNRSKLETLDNTLQEHESILAEYEQKKNEDIFNSTIPNRVGVKTLYQFSGTDDDQINKIINDINATFMKMYEEISYNLSEGETPYNVQRLFLIEPNLGQNQLTITSSRETEDLLKEYIDCYHTWVKDKFAEAKVQFEVSDTGMEIAEENIYEYYDNNIFNEQRAVADNLNNRRNNIINTKNSINSTNNDILNQTKKITELEIQIEEAQELRNNTLDRGDKQISKKALIVYAVIGGLIGIILAAVILAFVYMYGRKLRDYDNLQMLMSTDAYDGTDSERLERAITDIVLKAKKLEKKRIAVLSTKSIEPELQKKLIEVFEKYGIVSMPCDNALENGKLVDTLLDTDGAVLFEMHKVSLNRDIDRLIAYLNNANIPVLGGICG